MLTLQKNLFASQIEDGQSFDEIFFLESIQKKKKKKGGTYWTLTLRDRTGSIAGKLWKQPPGQLPSQGEFVKVRCAATTFNDEVELDITLIRSLDLTVECVDVTDFVPVGPRDRFALWHELTQHVELMTHPGLKQICRRVLTDPNLSLAFRDAPAAKTMHHAYVGGLLDHVLSLCNLVRSTMGAYRRGGRWPATSWSEDLLIAAAIWHDIGKTRELSWAFSIGYTTEGSLLGHVVVGLQLLSKQRKSFFDAVFDNQAVVSTGDVQQETRIWNHLEHIVASHHGRLEWGAAKTPMSREAALFHQLDMIDSRMGAFDSLDQESVDQDGFGSWSKTTDGPFWRMP